MKSGAAYGAVFVVALLLLPLSARAVELDQLPASTRSCALEDLSGMRKLRAVYENPEGAATDAFQRAPHQYMFFRPNQTYVEISGSQSYVAAKDMNEALKEKFTTDIRQFVLGENGALYFYKDGAATDAFTCSVVRASEPPFRVGDVLFILTKANSSDIVVKVYSRHVFSSSPAPKLQERGVNVLPAPQRVAPRRPSARQQSLAARRAQQASQKRRMDVQRKLQRAKQDAVQSDRNRVNP